jgi:DNA-binding GntR family transcriptional regulator
MPVREALGRLQAEGMVVFETYRGATVTPLSHSEAEQIYLMRIALEPLLGRLGSERLQPTGVVALDQAYSEMTAALDAGDAGRYYDQVRAFHETLYAAAGMSLVLEQVLGLRNLAQRYIRRYLALPGRLAHSVDNHRLLLDAVRAGSAHEVERLLREELIATRAALLASLSAGK